MSPLVSVVITSYNYEKYLPIALQSITASTYRDIEIVIVDDASQDGSPELIREFEQLHGDIFQIVSRFHSTNRGIVCSYREAIELCRGEFVCFLESDDFLKDCSIETRLQLLFDYPDVVLVYNDVEIFGTNKAAIQAMEKYCRLCIRQICRKSPFYGPEALFYNIIPCFSSVMIRRSALQELDFSIPDEFAPWLDRWLWAQIAFKGKFLYCSEKLTQWRFHGENYNRSNNHSIKDSIVRSSRFNKILHEMLRLRFLAEQRMWEYFILEAYLVHNTAK